MTLIATHLSRHGIVQASDSNLMAPGATEAIDVKKVFDIPHLQSSLSYSGTYGVGQVPMEKWMPEFVTNHSELSGQTLGTFARDLAEALQQGMTYEEACEPVLVHVAGYVKGLERSHPEMWLVSNVGGIDLVVTGEYTGVTREFRTSEQFWSRNCRQAEDGSRIDLLHDFQTVPGSHYWYVNGYTPARIAGNLTKQALDRACAVLWGLPANQWGFRAPRTLEEAVAFVKTYLKVVALVMQISTYDPVVGGDPQTHSIPAPTNVVATCW